MLVLGVWTPRQIVQNWSWMKTQVGQASRVVAEAKKSQDYTLTEILDIADMLDMLYIQEEKKNTILIQVNSPLYSALL